MKVIKKIACTALLFLLASCGSKTAYWNAIPEQSAAVAAIDLPRLTSRAGLDDKEGEAGVNRLKDMIKSGLEGSTQLVDRVFADFRESGIDFKEKIYLFSSDENAVFGLLAKVSSSGKLEDVVRSLIKEQICLPLRETDGCNWTVLGKWLLAYSDGAMMVLSDNKWADPSKLVRQASMWLRQEEGQGFAAKGEFEQLQLSDSDISLWTSLQLLPRNVLTPLTMGLSAEVDLKKIKAITTMNFETGKTIIDVNPLVTDQIMSQIMTKKAQAMAPIKGTHLDLFPVKTTFCTTAHIKGDAFYQFMRDIPALRNFFDYSDLPITLDFGPIFEAIDGDVSFTITDNQRKKYILWADVNQTEFLKVFTDLKPMIAKTNGMLLFEEQGENAYCIATRNGSVMNLRPGPKVFWLGVKKGKFYLTNDDELIDKRVLGLTLANKKWGKRVTDMKFFAYSDWNSLMAFEYLVQQDFLTVVPKSIPALMDYVTIESLDGQHVRCVVEQKDKNANLVQLLFQLPH